MNRRCRNNRSAWTAGIALASIGLLALPPLRAWLEASMVRHMLVQIPLLVAFGAAAVGALPATRRRRLGDALGGPVACALIAAFASTWWMLPRALDAALAEAAVETAKFVSLPLLVGAPAALAWTRFGLIGRGFVWTNLASMLLFLGWLYVAAPVRVCNSYLADDQLRVGWLLVEAGGTLFAVWLGRLFFSGRPATSSPPRIAPAFPNLT